MNERIRELAEQAGFIDKGNNHTAYMSFDHQKFAELIVKECADAIINDKRLSDVRSAANGCVRTVKEHFGVDDEKV